MKALINYLILVVGLLCLCARCDDEFDPDNQIKFINNSGVDLVMIIDYSISDTLLPPSDPYTDPRIYETAIIGKDSERNIPVETKAIKKYGYKLFLLSKEVVDNTTWEQIVADYQILHRYDLTLDSLEARNWIITYP